MLRIFVIVLLLANALFLAWTLGAMDHLIDVRSTGDREPERQSNQVRPSDLIVLSPNARTEARRSECLEAGPFDPVEMAVVEQAVSALPGGPQLVRRQADFPGVWVVLLGPYASRQTYEKKMDELRRSRLDFEEVTDLPAFKLSLVLGGRHSSAQAATAVLASLNERGVTSATVAALKPPTTQWFLRYENTDQVHSKQLRYVQSPRGPVVWTVCS